MADNVGLKKKSLKSDEDRIIHSILPANSSSPSNPAAATIKAQAAHRPEPVAESAHHIVIPESTPSPEPNDRHARNNVVPRHNISIKDVISGKAEIFEEPVKTAEPELETSMDDEPAVESEQSFSQEQLEEKWTAFAETVRAERPRMAIALRSRLPALKAGFQVEISLENTAQKEDFIASTKPYLQAFLRRELLNDLITISVLMEADPDEGKRKMYSTEEKFQYLNSKNPAVMKLKQQFNMEFE